MVSEPFHPTPPGSSPSAEPVEYLHQSVKVIRAREASKLAEMQNQGWELVTRSQGTIRTELTFRKVKPKTFASRVRDVVSRGYSAFRQLTPATQRRVLAVVGSVIVVLAIVAVTSMALNDDEDPSAPVATPQTSAESSEVPSESPSPSATESPTPTATPTPSATETTPKVITAANTKEFENILDGADCSGSIGKFAKEHSGETIQFDGSVVNVVPHGDYDTRFDYLLGSGDKGPNTTVGPLFKFEDVNYFDFNLTGKGQPDSIQVGGKFRFTAEVDRYEGNTCLFFLSPIETRTR